MDHTIFDFLLRFAVVLGDLATNLWAALDTEILGLPAWQLLGSTLIIAAIFASIIRGIVGG